MNDDVRLRRCAPDVVLMEDGEARMFVVKRGKLILASFEWDVSKSSTIARSDIANGRMCARSEWSSNTVGTKRELLKACVATSESR